MSGVVDTSGTGAGLEADALALLELLNAFPSVEAGTAAEARAASLARRRPPPPLPDVDRVAPLEVPGGAGPRPARGYWPLGVGPDAPLVAFFHGGGWVTGDLDGHDPLCRRLCAALGAVVVAVDYRLAPEHPFPAGLDDCVAAVGWLAGRAPALGADPARLAVAGDSAGANLAAATALVARDRGGPALAAQLLVYPVVDADFETPSYRGNATGWFVSRDAMRWYWDQYLADPAQAGDPRVAPLRAPDLAGLPPAVVVTATYDPLRDEGEAYAEALARAGVEVWARRYDAIHGFYGMELASAARARAESMAALALLLGRGGRGGVPGGATAPAPR